MWDHLGHLALRCGAQVLAWHSATGFSLAREVAIIPVLLYIGLRWYAIGRQPWREWFRLMGAWREIRPVLLTMGILLALTGSAFLASIPVVIYKDHQELATAKARALKDAAEIDRTNETLRARTRELGDKLAESEKGRLAAQARTSAKPPVHVESGAAYVPNNQAGGTVIGTVVGTVNTGPQAPQLFWESINSNVRNGETYDSTYMIHVVPAETIGVLRVDVGSTRKSLQHLYIFPLNGSGMTGTGNGSASNGAVVETLNAVTGDFRIRLVSTEPDYFDIKIGCAPVACSVTQQSH
jgi:hypothetical protein